MGRHLSQCGARNFTFLTGSTEAQRAVAGSHAEAEWKTQLKEGAPIIPEAVFLNVRLCVRAGLLPKRSEVFQEHPVNKDVATANLAQEKALR
jgi:hypothetical protein